MLARVVSTTAASVVNTVQSKKAEYMQKRLDRMASKLGLSETQKTQVQALMQNHRTTMKPLRDEKRAIREEMKALDPASEDYADKLAGIANRKGALREPDYYCKR